MSASQSPPTTQWTGGDGGTRPLSRSEPVALAIPEIGLRTDRLVRLGLTPAGRLETPEDWQAVGWYGNGTAPGESGPAVLAGHLDSTTGPAVFHRLEQLRRGDTVTVQRGDGTTAVFTVHDTGTHPKDSFPTDRVYGETDRAELRLITCGGDFDEGTGHYEDNTVVYAHLTGVRDRN
ncbi:sortase family protein [Haloactinospora alba]|uniref:Sortase family protein n=1 Tax=Haloactinospora alba TaxID=405555 RepID=A0A543N7Q0_9ACTN|nr:sortase family protein [Haloactinospora alba]